MRKPFKHILMSATIAAGTVATGAAMGVPAAHPAGAVTSSQLAAEFAALRQCESSGNYQTNTGNGYYGAYQFSEQTWLGLGEVGLPSNASKVTQDWAALKLYNERGWEPWPACSAKLGL